MQSKCITAKKLAITLFAHSVAATTIRGHPYITVPTGTVNTVHSQDYSQSHVFLIHMDRHGDKNLAFKFSMKWRKLKLYSMFSLIKHGGVVSVVQFSKLKPCTVFKIN